MLIPYHRVVRADGKIGNYALGDSENKRLILAAEGVAPGDSQRLVRGLH